MKKENEGGAGGVDGRGRGRRREEGNKKGVKQGKEQREESSVLLKTGGQTVGNWLGLQGLKERFKERAMESKLTDSGGGRERDDWGKT